MIYYSFVFPLSLVSEDGATATVGSVEELFTTLSDCEEIHTPCDSISFGGFLGCYDVQYPISFVLN